MNTFFQDIDIKLIGNNWLGLKVYLNEDELSIFNSQYFDMELSLFFLAGLAFFMSLLLISIYLFMKEAKMLTRGYEIFFALYIAASMASTIDRVFWGGSLDFIVIAGWIVDFKDIYISLGLAFILLYTLKNTNLESGWKEDFEYVKRYFKFLGASYNRIFSK